MTARTEQESLNLIVQYINEVEDILNLDDYSDAMQDKYSFVTAEKASTIGVLRGGLAMQMQQIGEECKGISEEHRDLYPNVKFRGFAGLSDVLRHDYPDIDAALLYEDINEKIWPLRDACIEILERLTVAREQSGQQQEQSREVEQAKTAVAPPPEKKKTPTPATDAKHAAKAADAPASQRREPAKAQAK